MCYKQVYEWCEERPQIQPIADDVLSKYVPAHVNTLHYFGGLVLTSPLIQGASGLALTIYFRLTVVEAFESVEAIIEPISLGWFIRSTHRWSSGTMFQMIILRVSRVYFTGGYKKPREATWTTGTSLTATTISFGVTGYSLPWDQIGFWACKIVTATPEVVDTLMPGIGSLLVLSLRSGYSVTQSTLSRLYSIHTLILPLLALLPLLVHPLLLRKQGISGPL